MSEDLTRQVQVLQWQLDQLRADMAEARNADASVPKEGIKVLRSGVAEIDSVDGSGAYTITEQWWKSSTSVWEDAIAPSGLVSQSARCFRERWADAASFGQLTGQVGQYVRFWQERRQDGELVTWIDLGRADTFWAKINGAAVASGTNRWIYPWVEVEKTASGYGGWTTLSGGRSGTTGSNPAYNSVEDMNSASGRQGNGVTVANLDTAEYTFEIEEAPDGVIVRMNEVSFVISGAVYVEYWFAYENGVDGVCD